MSSIEVDRVPQNGSLCEADSETEANISENNLKTKKKIRKRGIIYLSTIPPYMNVAKIREIFAQYGEVGRIFLQPSGSE